MKRFIPLVLLTGLSSIAASQRRVVYNAIAEETGFGIMFLSKPKLSRVVPKDSPFRYFQKSGSKFGNLGLYGISGQLRNASTGDEELIEFVEKIFVRNLKINWSKPLKKEGYTFRYEFIERDNMNGTVWLAERRIGSNVTFWFCVYSAEDIAAIKNSEVVRKSLGVFKKQGTKWVPVKKAPVTTKKRSR
ncbi:hypothetical protein EON81_12000 [bacterium]|nr:MAG: hypothetical protein EON81_12000 [bacterium]